MSLWLLKGPAISTSKTSIFVFSLASTLLISSNLFRKTPKYFGRFVLSFGLTFYLLQIVSEILFGDSLINLMVTSSGRDITLTGRTDLWAELMKIGALHPILGVGYGGFWISSMAHKLWTVFTWIPESAHNGYLDVYLELGLIGLMILCGVVISVYNKNAKMMLNNFEYGRIGLIFCIMILIYNITESSFTKTTNLLWFLFLLFGFQGLENVRTCQSSMTAQAGVNDRVQAN
jgi:O-antigen ligase